MMDDEMFILRVSDFLEYESTQNYMMMTEVIRIDVSSWCQRSSEENDGKTSPRISGLLFEHDRLIDIGNEKQIIVCYN